MGEIAIALHARTELLFRKTFDTLNLVEKPTARDLIEIERF